MSAAKIRHIDLSSVLTQSSTRDEIRKYLPRAALDVQGALASVEKIMNEVRIGGVDALIDIGEKFDGVRVKSLRVPLADITKALDSLDPHVRKALVESIERIKKVHAAQTRSEQTVTVIPGGKIGRAHV